MQVVLDRGVPLAQFTDQLSRVARSIFRVEARDERGLSAAGWHLPGRQLIREPASHHILTYHAQPGVTMTRVVNGVCSRKVLRQGSVTLARAGDHIEVSWDRPLDVVHLYIHPDALSRHALQRRGGNGRVRLQAFFGIEDAWLAGYFQMLVGEAAEGGAAAQGLAEFLEMSQALLLRRLIQCHAEPGAGMPHRNDAETRPGPLRPTVLRRIDEHLQAHLAEHNDLAMLAGIANLSVDHFLRSFRAAAGTTPHRYIMDLRLAKAAAMLRETVLPVAEVATACGFLSASHFAVAFGSRFGLRPSAYRRSH